MKTMIISISHKGLQLNFWHHPVISKTKFQDYKELLNLRNYLQAQFILN